MTAVRREPRVLVGLQAAAAEQLERVVTQLAICQMPRVADRVHAMLWLLADSFGRVGTAGTRVPLSLTHEIIGGLVGARRPTVTLALGELSKRGAVVQQDGGWLLLEPFEPQHTETKHRLEEPKLLDLEPSEWAVREGPVLEPSIALEALVDTVGRLREEHRVRVQQVTDRLARVRRSRERTSEVLRRVRAGRGVSSRLPPST
jgi:CRP-like cAMP-binding protein